MASPCLHQHTIGLRQFKETDDYHWAAVRNLSKCWRETLLQPSTPNWQITHQTPQFKTVLLDKSLINEREDHNQDTWYYHLLLSLTVVLGNLGEVEIHTMIRQYPSLPLFSFPVISILTVNLGTYPKVSTHQKV